MSEQSKAIDIDPTETGEWLDSLQSVLEREGGERAHYLLETLIDEARRSGAHIPFTPHTAYVNTIPAAREKRTPGDPELERRIHALIRWNAMAMVMRANKESDGIGGHIASFASIATLYDVGFNHFWHAPGAGHGGDLIFFQGHSAPGIYARAFLEGRLSEQDLKNFRREAGGKGLSSYPHPWLMPDFWQFPTVSMGLGPIQAIYQARFLKYLHNRGLADTAGRKVWCFIGDGESDEPETMGAISLAGRENLDNLIFVVNCNLQRLDGPVRGNGKIIQELEGEFRGSGWNVIKLIWGSYWDPLLARDTKGLLRKRMEEAVDGEYQAFKAKGGAYTREHFFGKYPQLRAMVANMSDDDIWRLNRGGHDPHKVYAAYAEAVAHTGQPTVVLAKTVKGYGMGESGEGQNATHSQKKLAHDSLIEFRDRFKVPLSNEQLEEMPFYRPADDSPEIKYMLQQRQALGGFLPARRKQCDTLKIPPLSTFKALLADSGERTFSTTMAFVRILTALTRDKEIGNHIVPIIPDEARTFGMEGLFRQLGIYAPSSQLYTPEDADQMLYYREDRDGQVLQEGITESGAMASWMAAATSYSNSAVKVVPFYIFYSMFGFQRIGDLAWAAGDIQARGFLIGGTAGRTSLAGEGLQHQDGSSMMLASAIPNCVSYDPAFACELAVIIHSGLRRMFSEHERVFYYITAMNENYAHPALPKGVEEDIIKGLYLFRKAPRRRKKRALVELIGGGAILREVIAAAELLDGDFGIDANIWSATSFNELAREAVDCERWNTLHPQATPRISHVKKCFHNRPGPVIAATDYVRAYADQIREFLPPGYCVLGTDGFGRSDAREELRQFFEVDRYHIVIRALKALADRQEVLPDVVSKAIISYGIDADKPNPMQA
jgi:pyruvate dehydrogenase E1 component